MGAEEEGRDTCPAMTTGLLLRMRVTFGWGTGACCTELKVLVPLNCMCKDEERDPFCVMYTYILCVYLHVPVCVCVWGGLHMHICEHALEARGQL